MRHKLALIGFGTVGQGLCEILDSRRDELQSRYNFEFDVVAVSSRSLGTAYHPDGLDIQQLIKEKQAGSFLTHRVDWDAITMIQNSNATVVCEMTHTNLDDGGPAIAFCETALKSGKHVITCNKGPVALEYPNLKKLADQNGLAFLFEGTVMSGTPVLSLAQGALAGSRIMGVRGILNGTTNFMLSEMEKGMSYADALTRAQELGYAEADPSGDVEGYDAQAKVAVLAQVVMELDISLDQVSRQGITSLTTEDITIAIEQGSRWKLVASISREDGEIIARVQPECLPLTDPLADVMGTTCALTYSTDLLGDVTITGPGAGSIQTGFSLISDLLKLHNSR